MNGTSLDPGTSRRMSTPSRAASWRAWKSRGGGHHVRVGDPQPFEARRREDLQRSCRPAPGRAAPRRSRGPRRCRRQGPRRWRRLRGIVPPARRPHLSNARSRAAAAGPRSRSPVSRQGRRPRRGVAVPFVADAEAARSRPGAPSATTSLRWSRERFPKMSNSRGGLKAAHLDSRLPQEPPELRPGPDAAEPVVQHPDFECPPRPGPGQRLGEAPAGPVVRMM